MGGGASKSKYTMITDRKLTKAHYEAVESNSQRRLNRAVSGPADDLSARNSNQADITPPRPIQKGKSMLVLGSGAMGPGAGGAIAPASRLKKGMSEKGMAIGDRRKPPPLKKGKSEAVIAQAGGGGKSMTMSLRLPWLVKNANIVSCKNCFFFPEFHNPSSCSISNSLYEIFLQIIASAPDRIKYGRIIGRGLMGTVRVCELDTGKFVAVKTISKKYVKKHNDMRHINAERTILKEMTSPFCIRLFGTFQDEQNIHMILEYAPGGELFRRITRRDSFPSEVAKFYTAEVFMALDHVQKLGYVFRDLKPENVMLDEYGHCKLIDFGFAMIPNESGLCTTNVGTPAYLSPEQLNGKFTKGYTKAVDWWAFGIFLYELLTSKTPFCNSFSESSFEIYSRVLKGKIKYPGNKFTPENKDLVSSLLHPDIKRRMVDPRAIEKHAFFADVDWKAVGNRQVIPPFTPRLPTSVITDTQTICHFDDWGPDPKPPPTAAGGAKYNTCIDHDFYNF